MEENKQSEPKALTKMRGAANPYVGLESALTFTDQLRKAVGKGPFSRDVAARGLNHTSLSGPAIGKIAALVHFALLSREGNAYSITSLADRILLPVSDDDKSKTIVEAVSKPKLYKQLIDKYRSQALPLLLDNILVREYGINEKRAKDVAKTFRKSLEFAGILHDGIISEGNSADVVKNETARPGTTSVVNSPISSDIVSTGGYLVDLPSGIKIEFPKTLSYNVVVGDFSDEIKSLNEKALRTLQKDINKEEKP